MPVKKEIKSVPVPPCPVDGPGSAAFSNKGLIASLILAPALVTLLIGGSLLWFPLLFAVLALPTCIYLSL